MTKRKIQRQPYAPPTAWDAGTGTPAQRAGLIIEDAADVDPDTGRRRNPNGVKRARRIDMAEHYHIKGDISRRQLNAAQKLRTAYEATMRSPPAIQEVRVDSSAKPDANVAIQIDRQSTFAWIYSMVQTEDRRIIGVVVLNNCPVHAAGYRGRRHHRGVQKLADALEALANAMGS